MSESYEVDLQSTQNANIENNENNDGEDTLGSFLLK